MVSITPRLEVHFSNHREFHLYYLSKHTARGCRRLHLLGTAVAVLGIILNALFVRRLACLLTTVGLGLVVCWAGDYLVQKTTPTFFRYPLWSLRSNFKMLNAMVKGEMGGI